MKHVAPYLVAGAAVVTPLALAMLARRGASFGGGSSQGGGAGTTFGLDEDGEFTEEEGAFCAEQLKIAEALVAEKGGPVQAAMFCMTNPSDARCAAVKMVDACNDELTAHTRNHQDDAIVDAASGAVKKVGGVVFGVVDAALDAVSGKVLAVGALAVVGFIVYRRYAP